MRRIELLVATTVVVFLCSGVGASTTRYQAGLLKQVSRFSNSRVASAASVSASGAAVAPLPPAGWAGLVTIVGFGLVAPLRRRLTTV